MKPLLRNGLLAAGLAIPASLTAVFVAAPDAASTSYFATTRVRTDSGKFVHSERLGNSDYCGHCHTQIFHEWNASTHHFSSLNNPVYRSVVQSTAERRGPETLRVCAECHEPLPLVAGEPITGQITHWSSTAGITCLACHRITEVRGENGAYTVGAPTLHPFALSDYPWQQRLHGWLLETFPGLHRAVLSKPFYDSAEYCATCHTVLSTREMNGHGDLLLQNEYASWSASRFAPGRAAAGETKSCIDCHMPQVPSDDPAARDGMTRSHRFVGGNTLIPHLNRDREQLVATEAFLKSGAVTLSCKRVTGDWAMGNGQRVNGQSAIAIQSTTATQGTTPARGTAAAQGASCDQARAGRAVEITLELANRGVGHDFPAGTKDSNQVWLEVSATDAAGRTLYHSGALTPDGDPDAAAYALRTTYVDGQGRLVDRRTATTDAVASTQTTVLSPGERREVSYQIELDERTRFPVTVAARLNWRKFSAAFLRSVFQHAAQPEIPLTVIDEVAVKVEGKSG